RSISPGSVGGSARQQLPLRGFSAADGLSPSSSRTTVATREAFLRQVWTDIINAPIRGTWIDATIADAEARPDAAVADAGFAVQRLLQLGAHRAVLNAVVRFAAYEAAFTLLYMLGDPGVDGDQVTMLHESLLGADPGGREGRPAI